MTVSFLWKWKRKHVLEQAGISVEEIILLNQIVKHTEKSKSHVTCVCSATQVTNRLSSDTHEGCTIWGRQKKLEKLI